MEMPLSLEARLRRGDAQTWDELVEAVGPAAMLVRIERRMGDALRRKLTAEDVWQDTLLHAWRDRERHEWRGVVSFRRWLLQIAENRIRDTLDRDGALKRSADCVRSSGAGSGDNGGSQPSSFGDPSASTTPSRDAVHREQAELMRSALEQVPALQREVVWRRVFEEQSLEQIAAAMQLTQAAVKHRLRKGSAIYCERLRALLGSRTGGSIGNP